MRPSRETWEGTGLALAFCATKQSCLVVSGNGGLTIEGAIAHLVAPMLDTLRRWLSGIIIARAHCRASKTVTLTLRLKTAHVALLVSRVHYEHAPGAIFLALSENTTPR
jgi:hypothetical protein